MAYDLDQFIADCRSTLGRDPGPPGREQVRQNLERLLKNKDFVEKYCGDDQPTGIKVLYEDKEKGEMTCLLKWEPGATLPMHKHPEIEQTYVIEGSFYDHDGICRAGEFVWRRVGSFHETHSDEGAVILAIYRKPNVFQHSAGYSRQGSKVVG